MINTLSLTIDIENGVVRKLMKKCKKKDNSCNLFKLSGEDINGEVEDLAKSSVRSLWNLGEGKLETKALILAVEMNHCVNTSQSSCNEEELVFTYINWNKKVHNNNDIKFIFDWNTAEINFMLNGNDNYNNPQVRIKSTAKSYKKLSLTGYGLGRRGSTWKGGRVKFDDEK